MYYRIYAKGIELEEISKDVKGIAEAKAELLKWDETLSEDYCEMGMIDLKSGEDIGWLDVIEMDNTLSDEESKLFEVG